ncbi:uncharacterized protein [Embiotoca jacksoni]|uniref:uncharacterized protein n=1 Tax=Embiotoca jacksoni TaxID=100190 RepID=UPI003703F7C2
MNSVKNSTLRALLRDEEVHVVENSIRLAIDSIVNVLYGVNSSRTRECQRMVADRDREIRRLEGRLTDIERELLALRRHGCTCGRFGTEHGPGRCRSSGEQSGMEGRIDPEMSAGTPDLGLFAGSPSHSFESALPSSPSRMGLDQTCTSGSSEGSGVTATPGYAPTSPGGLAIKEEPCDMDDVFIKWEMTEESSPCRGGESLEKLENREGRKFREKPQAELGGYGISEGDHLMHKKPGVAMSAMSEEAQRVKRAAWRAASRRYYARKIARQQANPSSRSASFPHVSNSPYSQLSSFMDKRRRPLISELPADSQTVQREAWRAASRRYYARKVARHQPETMAYGLLLDGVEPSGDPNSGRILCS